MSVKRHVGFIASLSLTSIAFAEHRQNWELPVHAPRMAVLADADASVTLSVAVLLLLILIGGGTWVVWGTFRKNKSTRAGRGTWVRGSKAATFLGWLTMLVGIVCSVFLLVVPTLNVVRAHSWAATPCTILSSALERHASDRGATYEVAIVYEYEFGGRALKSDRYSFWGGSTAGGDAKGLAVLRHAVGSGATCFVDPADPGEAVLNRGFVPWVWIGLIGPVFMAFGVFVFRHIRRVHDFSFPIPGIAGAPAEQRARIAATWLPSLAGADFGPVTFSSGSTRLRNAVALSLVCLVWNGFVGFWGLQVLDSWKAGRGQLFGTVFIAPFLLFGLVVVGFAVRSVLQLSNPTAHLTLGSRFVGIGQSFGIDWYFTGRAHRIRRVEILLEGRERATYVRRSASRHGPSSITDTYTFASIKLAVFSSETASRAGSLSVNVPEGTMHSFAGVHNKIVWCLRVKAGIPHWPDVDDEFPIYLVPVGVLG